MNSAITPRRDSDSHDQDDVLDGLDVDELDALRALAAAPPRHDHRTVRLEPGSRLTEHLTIERHLGAGGMGTVFLAHDSRLLRHVAVKLHLGTDAKQLALLEREAQALAKVSHPNVLSVHEVGTVGPRLFVATEYVEGETIAEWIETERSWREIVEVFIAAGEGLAAAHEAGLVHRDFKPANVLLGRDGRVRVADFGLAKLASEASPPGREPTSVADETGRDADDSASPSRPHPTTQRATAGAMAGTPAYMAPEQFAGRSSPLADQFSFCVALAEALTGARPYGDRLASEASPDDFSLARGPRPRPPRRLASLLERGAALDPSARYPDMGALIDALRRVLSPRRRVALAGVALALVAGVGVVWAQQTDATSPCTDLDADIETVWHERRADALAAAFAAAHPSAGPGSWAPLRERLDRYAEAWARERDASCRATHVGGAQSDRALEQSMACFERRRAELDASLRALARVEGAAVAEAWQVIPQVSALAACRDPTQLAAWAEHEPRSSALASEFAYVRALSTLGQLDLAREELDRVTARAELRGDAPAEIFAEYERAIVVARDTGGEPALSLAESVYFAARDAAMTEVERQSALLMASLTLRERGDAGAAKVWLRLANALDGGSRLSPECAWIEAIILEQEDPQAAIDLLLAALDQLGEHGDLDERLRLLDGLNTAYDANGQPEAALETIDLALDLAESLSATWGSTVWPLLSNRGLVLSQLGRHDEAVSSHRAAIEIVEQLHGREFVDSRGLALNLALGLAAGGDSEAALELLPEIYDATRAHYGDDNPDVALVLEVRGQILADLGRAAEGLADFHAALAIARSSLGPAHPDVGRYLQQIAELNRELGRREAELEASLASVRAYEAAGLADHPRTRSVRRGAAAALVSLERDVEALALLEGSFAASDPAASLGDAWRVTHALLANPETQARAARLAATLRTTVAEAGHPGLLAKIDAQLGAAN